MSVEQLKQAKAAIQNGDKAHARNILRKMILAYPRDEQAWYLMAQVVEKREQAVDCLERVLKINPYNQQAEKALSILKHAKPRPVSSSPVPVRAAVTAVSPAVAPPVTPAHITPAVPAQTSTARVYPPRARPVTPRAMPLEAPEEPKELAKRAPRIPVNWPLLFGSLIVFIVAAIAIAGPRLSPRDPLEENVIVKIDDEWEIPPVPAFKYLQFPLGTDQFGRDMLSRILWAVRPTLTMVAVVALVRLLLGTTIGLGAGWSSGRLGTWLDTLITAALAIPVFIVTLGAIAMLGAEMGLMAFIIGFSINGWGETARIVREQTLAIKSQLYIEAARAMGASQRQILTGHVLRQIMSMVWMLFAFEISNTLMVTAGLGFLGYYIGGDVWIEVGDFVSRRVSGMPELGQMLATSWVSLIEPWPMVLTGTMIFISVLGFNLLGEGLRVRLNPEKAKRNTLLARATRRLSWWLEENVTHPVSAWVRANSLRLGLASAVVVVAGGSFYWWRTQVFTPIIEARVELPVPGDHLWASELGDPYGTRWDDSLGPAHPEIQWQLQSEAGFAGGPVIASDETIYIGINDGRLLALNPDGSTRWETNLPEIPVGPPALSAEGIVYIGDQEGGLSAVSPQGELLWHFEQEDVGKPIHGPIVDLDGNITYLLDDPRVDHLVSLTPDGNLRWSTRTGTHNAGVGPRLSPEGDVVYLKNKIIDLNDGTVQDFVTPADEDPILADRAQYVIGADGEHYLHVGHTVIHWRLSAAGFETISSASSPSHGQTANYPHDAGVTPNQVVWVFYSWQYGGTRIVWMDVTGRLLGTGFTALRQKSKVVTVDATNTAYICGAEDIIGSELSTRCLAYAEGREEPEWELVLGEEVRGYVIGTAFVLGRIYVVTEDGFFFVIGESSTPGEMAGEGEIPSEEVTHEQSTPVAEAQPTLTETDEATSEVEMPTGEGTPLPSQIAWSFQVPEPILHYQTYWYDVGAGLDGSVSILAESNTFYYLSPQGELRSRVSLDPAPYRNEEEQFIIDPILLPGETIVVVSQENTAYGMSFAGDLRWEVALEGEPVAAPVFDRENIYLADKKGNLYAFASGGLVWKYLPAGGTKTTAAPIVAPDGTIYYVVIVDKKAYVQAVSPGGQSLWAIPVRTSFFYEPLQINAFGNLLFLKEDIYDTQQGILLDLEPPPFPVDDYVMGDDGLTYMRSGQNILQWQIRDNSFEILETITWNYQGFSRPPFWVRVSPDQIIWMYYAESIVWLDKEGNVLGTPPTYGGSIVSLDFTGTRVTFCFQVPHTDQLECDSYAPGSDRPSWEANFKAMPNTTWGFVNEGNIYAVTQEDIVYKLEVSLP